MKQLHNITFNQMRSLLKYYKKTVQDRDKENITVREMEKDLIWNPRSKAFIEVTKDRKEYKHKDLNKKLELEIMFRQQTIEQLNRDIELVEQFMESAKTLCNDDDYIAISYFMNGMNIDRIGFELSRSYNNIHYRIEKAIKETLEKIRENIILDKI